LIRCIALALVTHTRLRHPPSLRLNQAAQGSHERLCSFLVLPSNEAAFQSSLTNGFAEKPAPCLSAPTGQNFATCTPHRFFGGWRASSRHNCLRRWILYSSKTCTPPRHLPYPCWWATPPTSAQRAPARICAALSLIAFGESSGEVRWESVLVLLFGEPGDGANSPTRFRDYLGQGFGKQDTTGTPCWWSCHSPGSAMDTKIMNVAFSFPAPFSCPFFLSALFGGVLPALHTRTG
jgi:hypothetical protein